MARLNTTNHKIKNDHHPLSIDLFNNNNLQKDNFHITNPFNNKKHVQQLEPIIPLLRDRNKNQAIEKSKLHPKKDLNFLFPSKKGLRQKPSLLLRDTNKNYHDKNLLSSFISSSSSSLSDDEEVIEDIIFKQDMPYKNIDRYPKKKNTIIPRKPSHYVNTFSSISFDDDDNDDNCGLSNIYHYTNSDNISTTTLESISKEYKIPNSKQRSVHGSIHELSYKIPNSKQRSVHGSIHELSSSHRKKIANLKTLKKTNYRNTIKNNPPLSYDSSQDPIIWMGPCFGDILPSSNINSD
jgi:hypothetical protein